MQGVGATPKAKDAAEIQEGTVLQCSICWIHCTSLARLLQYHGEASLITR